MWVGIVLGFQITFNNGDREFVTQRLDGGFQQGSLAGTGRGHQVNRQYGLLIKVLTVMCRLMIIFGQQIFQYGDSRLAIFCTSKFAVIRYQVCIAVCHITAAGIAHDDLR
jgi:hypothetical protein